MKRSLSLAAAFFAALAAAPAPAADTISATHVFPASLVYSRSFLEYVKKANAAGKGVFTIQVRGGPEAIPMMQQPGSLRDGVVDMVYTACAFYAATVPECDAMSASTIMATRSSKLTVGRQWSLRAALEASPISRSTSAGRMRAGSRTM